VPIRRIGNVADPSPQAATVVPATIDPESERWLAELRGPRRDAAVADLHDRLRRIAGAEVSRRGSRIPFAGPELDDVVTTAADDATLAVLAKLDDFRGESRFTTWAAKFAILEVSNKVGRHLWRAEGVHLDPDAWERMPDRFGLGPGREAETRELLAGLREAVATELSERQRRVFEAIVLNEVPLDVLTVELDTNRNAIYKTLFDARRKLRASLVANELVDP
jgi:RNA polymerase sigma-70 factor, ECF subfamily